MKDSSLHHFWCEGAKEHHFTSEKMKPKVHPQLSGCVSVTQARGQGNALIPSHVAVFYF